MKYLNNSASTKRIFWYKRYRRVERLSSILKFQESLYCILKQQPQCRNCEAQPVILAKKCWQCEWIVGYTKQILKNYHEIWISHLTWKKTKIKCSSRSIEATTNPKIKKPTTDGVDVFLYHSMQNIQVIYQCWKCSAVDRPIWFLLLEFLKETETERDGKILKIVFKAKLLNYIQSTSMLCDIKDSLFKSMVHICIYDFESKSKNSW